MFAGLGLECVCVLFGILGFKIEEGGFRICVFVFFYVVLIVDSFVYDFGSGSVESSMRELRSRV